MSCAIRSLSVSASSTSAWLTPTSLCHRPVRLRCSELGQIITVAKMGICALRSPLQVRNFERRECSVGSVPTHTEDNHLQIKHARC